MTRVQRSDRDAWWARFDYIEDGQAKFRIFDRNDDQINDDSFLQYLDQVHAALIERGVSPLVRKGRAAT